MAARLAYGSAVVKRSTGKVLDVEVERNEAEARKSVSLGNELIQASNAKPGVSLNLRYALVEIREVVEDA
jgi:hypothetical protein